MTTGCIMEGEREGDVKLQDVILNPSPICSSITRAYVVFGHIILRVLAHLYHN